MRVEEINCHGSVPITNGIYSDFIYVCSGQLKIDFVKLQMKYPQPEPKSDGKHNDNDIEWEEVVKSEELVEGDYIDDVWKRKSVYADFSIKRITAVPYSNKPVGTNFERKVRRAAESRGSQPRGAAYVRDSVLKFREHRERTNTVESSVSSNGAVTNSPSSTVIRNEEVALSKPSTYIILNYNVYDDFAKQQDKTNENLMLRLQEIMPGFGDLTR
tara:strand:- start:179 stop:823 length:645 start_codon:yes stop_codon:yes gene_type:complete